MKKLCAQIGVVCLVVLLASSAYALEIQLQPRTLVLSSGGDQLTIHTDFPYGAAEDVALDIGASSDVFVVTWSDDRGNLVVRCSKEAVREAVSENEFDRQFTTVDVTLTVNGSAQDTEVLRVRK